MSIQILQLELEARTGRDLLPSFFPIELLIVLTREIALVSDSALSHDELRRMTLLMKAYLRRVLEMHGAELLAGFNEKVDEMMTPLVAELYDCLSEEIVSRLIGYDVRSMSLRERFAAVLDGVKEPA